MEFNEFETILSHEDFELLKQSCENPQDNEKLKEFLKIRYANGVNDFSNWFTKTINWDAYFENLDNYIEGLKNEIKNS